MAIKRAVIKTVRKNKDVKTSEPKDFTLDSTKNHLKLLGKYEITLNEVI